MERIYKLIDWLIDKAIQTRFFFKRIRRKFIESKRAIQSIKKIIRYPIDIPKYIIEQIRLGYFPRIDRNLLKTDSPLERKFYYAIRDLYHGKIHAQYPFGPFWIDFALPEYKLALECDGKNYHSGLKNEVHDYRRDEYMQKRGWKVMRFSSKRIHHFMPDILAQIEKHIDKLEQKKLNPLSSTTKEIKEECEAEEYPAFLKRIKESLD